MGGGGRGYDKFQLASFKDQQGVKLSVSLEVREGERRCRGALIKKEIEREGDRVRGEQKKREADCFHRIIKVKTKHCQLHQQSALRSMVVL